MGEEFKFKIPSTKEPPDIMTNNITESANNYNETAEICHDILNSIIDRVSSLDKSSEDINIRFSQESGYSEDYFSEDLPENHTQNGTEVENQIQIEKELQNISETPPDDSEFANLADPSTTNITGSNIDGMLSPTYYSPHTPAHSEDSGRFSSAAYHSDIEGEITNRSVHIDSGIEMSHHSEDEDDNVSGAMPFKDLDPTALSFYKKKCESLLEVSNIFLLPKFKFYLTHLKPKLFFL